MEGIITALKNIQAPGSFCSKKVAPLDNFNLDIKQFGALSLPLKAKDAKALIKLAKPAKFSFRDKTLLDKNVRNAWESSKTNIKINNAL